MVFSVKTDVPNRGQGHQNLITSLQCPDYISMKIW